MKRKISYMKKQRLKDLKDKEKKVKELNKEIYTSLGNLLERLITIALKEKELNIMALKKYDDNYIKFGYCKKLLKKY